MQSTYDTAMTRGVFPHEGGYTDEATDPGGPTNWGITIGDARAYWKPTATSVDVRIMPKATAEDIYRQHYATPVHYDDLPAGVDYSVLDYAINSGVGRAGIVLRRLVGLPDNTSAITPEVIAAVKKRDPVALINAINSERMRFLSGLKNWPTYANGWTRRVGEVRVMSLSFAAQKNLPAVSNSPAQGKGMVPEPRTAKKIIVVAGGAGGTGLIAWAHQHPALSLLTIVAAICVISGIVFLVNLRHHSQQMAATPGVKPVPEAA